MFTTLFSQRGSFGQLSLTKLHAASTKRALAVVALTLGALLIGCENDGSQAPFEAGLQESEAHATVWFDQSRPVAEALQIMSGKQVVVTQLVQILDVNGETFTIMRPVSDGASIEKAQARWQDDYETFLQSLAKVSESLNAEETRQYLERLQSAREQANRRIVAGVAVSGSEVAIAALQREPNVTVESINLESGHSLGKHGAENQIAVDPNTWVPRYGWAITGQLDYARRFVYNTMVWDNTTGFGFTSTYEHKFYLNAYKNFPGTYLSRRQDRYGFPIVMAATNLPFPYLDSRRGDDPREISYAIGSAQAVAIQPGKGYFTYIYTDNGDDDQDLAKLVAELGFRYPADCMSAGCSYRLQKVFILPGVWPIPVPSWLFWRR